ncbi:hypothetical protein CDL15_Pgr017800 [Punica granatum]|uniref:Uncharacterized protein n=1 Tax=Punica granatum TaxID=22663 RepID=A0A218WGF7_PUNGR|nr:hypothetical protein CDL15_Pgr017800 [Punica granatum]PKI55970.1 hypothetical protein CRG98_023646 [Punica granatum]
MDSDRSPLLNLSPVFERTQGRSPALHRGPVTSYQRANGITGCVSQQISTENADFQNATEITIPQRKRKNEFSIEEFLQLLAPHAKILNKMARTIGEVIQQDWITLQSGDTGEGFNRNQLWEPTSHFQSPSWKGVHQELMPTWPNLMHLGTQYAASEMEDEVIPKDIQMAGEAGLIKPPKKP